MMISRPVGYEMGPHEDTSEQIGSPNNPLPPPLRYSRSKKFGSFFSYHTVIVVLLVISNLILAFKGMSLYNTITEALVNNNSVAEQTNIALEKALVAAQIQIMRSKLAIESADLKQQTLLEHLSSEVKAIADSSSTSSAQEQDTAGADTQDTANADNQGMSITDDQAPLIPVFSDCPPMDFVDLGTRVVTDKVIGAHAYHRLYGPYMTPVRCEPIKLLEIGLGCDMGYGAGHSLSLWLEFFPYAEIYFIEYDKKCAEKYSNIDERVKIFVGDQADRAFLRSVIEQTGGNFDFIIDDGGHRMDQQQTSLEEFVPALKLGGVYFLEDLLTSFMPAWGGHGDSDSNTTVNYIKAMMSDMHSRRGNYAPNLKPLTYEISRIDCIDEMCAFTRKKLDQ